MNTSAYKDSAERKQSREIIENAVLEAKNELGGEFGDPVDRNELCRKASIIANENGRNVACDTYSHEYLIELLDEHSA